MAKKEALFTNTTKLDGSEGKEYLRLVWSNTAAATRTVLYAVTTFAVGYAVYLLITAGTSAWRYMLAMAVTGILAFCVARWGYLLRLPAYKRRQRELWDGDFLEKTVTFYENSILQTSRLGEIELKYKEVTRYLEGKTLIALMIDGSALVIKKEGFGEESLNTFRMHIAKKCGFALRRRRQKADEAQ